MEKDNNTDQGYLSTLGAAQKELVLPSESWSDDEAFVPVFGGYTEKGEGGDNTQSSNDPAQHIKTPAQGIEDPIECSNDQDQDRYDYAQHNDNHTQEDYDMQRSTSTNTKCSDSVQDDHTQGSSHARGGGSGIGSSDDTSKPSDTPESKNRVLYIQGLSPQATYHNIFEKLRDVGKIYSINMIKSSIRGFHSTSLGVVMWDWPATRRLAMQVEDGLLDRDGFKPEVKFTSGWFDMAVPRASHRSRVLVITGSAAVVRQESIVGLLRESIANLALDEVIVTSPTPDLTAMEIRFAGYRGQAELAYQKLTSDPRIARWATTEFGPDPCDLVPEDGSALD